jgi:phytoene dehydrogenase-like protein
VHLATPVRALELAGGRVVGVRTDERVHPVAAVVATVDPWHVVDDLLPRSAGTTLRRRTRRLRPAGAATVTHSRLDEPSAEVTETVELSADGVPVVSYRRPVEDGTVVSRHDFGRQVPTPGAGVAWHGFRRWLDFPPVSTDLPGLYTASPASPAGNGPSQVILSGALASYAVHDGLG